MGFQRPADRGLVHPPVLVIPVSSFPIPRWYAIAGRVARSVAHAIGSPRVAPWPEHSAGSVWIHAASLGELKGAIRLSHALTGHLPATLTCTTSAGLAKLRRELPDACTGILPLDERSVVDSFLDVVRPCSAVFLEAEAWPVALAALSDRSIPVAFAAFRDTPTSVARWNRFARLFPGWTDSVDTVWTGAPGRVEAVSGLGFRDVRPGASLKWAGIPIPPIDPTATRSAAISIHARDLAVLGKLATRWPQSGWLWYPRRLALRFPLGLLARVHGLRVVDQPRPDPGEVWIAPRFGLVAQTLHVCRRAWVSPGHDLEEPRTLGVAEVFTENPPIGVAAKDRAPDAIVGEIVSWAMSAGK